MEKTITVFGSAIPLPGSDEYEIAYNIGKLLAKNGLNVCTGGSQGIMDAVSKGAKEEGKYAIGVTVDLFNSVTSEHLTTEIKCDTLFERIDNLINYGDGFIILPGGTGTLLELSVVWELVNKKIIEQRPVVCLGEMWKKIIDVIDERLVYENKLPGIVKHYNSVEEAVEFIIFHLNKN